MPRSRIPGHIGIARRDLATFGGYLARLCCGGTIWLPDPLVTSHGLRRNLWSEDLVDLDADIEDLFG